MNIYIDNNILIDYEDGKKDLPVNRMIKYVYSYVHLQELQELKKNLEKKKCERLHIIEKLTNDRYVSHGNNNQLIISTASPYNVFENLNTPLMNIISQQIHEATAHWKVDENPKFLMNLLGIEKKKINNYTPEILIERYGQIIKSYIASTCNNRQEVFQSLFNILDALGYWQDKVNSGSTMNRSLDAHHAYYATSCDYFVTDDKNTRKKANVVYVLYQYKTKAVSYLDFINLIS